MILSSTWKAFSWNLASALWENVSLKESYRLGCSFVADLWKDFQRTRYIFCERYILCWCLALWNISGACWFDIFYTFCKNFFDCDEIFKWKLQTIHRLIQAGTPLRFCFDLQIDSVALSSLVSTFCSKIIKKYLHILISFIHTPHVVLET